MYSWISESKDSNNVPGVLPVTISQLCLSFLHLLLGWARGSNGSWFNNSKATEHLF